MKDNIVYIKSSTNNSFGTGFVIDEDENGIYVLTCQHVVDDVEVPLIEKVLATVVTEPHFIDMAVLYVKGVHIPPLLLQFEGCDSLQVEVVGFSYFDAESRQKQNIQATLYKESSERLSPKKNFSYSIRKLKANDGFKFERGNSGSPVICKHSNRVIAMISNKDGNHIGYAIEISNLKKVWKDMPSTLLKPNIEKISGNSQEVKNRTSHSLLQTTIKKKKSPILKYTIIFFLILTISYVGYRIPYKLERDRLDVLIEKIDILSQHIEPALRVKESSSKRKIQKYAHLYAEELNASIEDKYLNTKLKIFKYAKVSFAYLMAASFEPNKKEKIMYEKASITSSKEALKLIENIKNEPSSKKETFTWMTQNELENRIKLFMARAYLLQVNEGGKSLSAEETKFVKEICPWYYTKTESNQNNEMEFFLVKHPKFCPN